ncbi:TetR-like C-terminal domain-containing protein [Streptomyces sp. M19]
MARGELPPDTDTEGALDLLAALVYWHVCVRFVPPDADFLERSADLLLRALAARPAADGATGPSPRREG